MADTTFNVEIDNIDTLTNAFKRAPSIVEPILQQAIVTASAILAKYTVRPNVPYRTGYLIQTFRSEISQLMARWFPTADYAPDVEFGTKAHVIVPINKKALYWPGAAYPVRRVNHPGTKANPYMEAILAASENEINDTFKEAGTAIAGALAE